MKYSKYPTCTTIENFSQIKLKDHICYFLFTCLTYRKSPRAQEGGSRDGFFTTPMLRSYNVAFEVGSDKLQHILVSKGKNLLQLQFSTKVLNIGCDCAAILSCLLISWKNAADAIPIASVTWSQTTKFFWCYSPNNGSGPFFETFAQLLGNA